MFINTGQFDLRTKARILREQQQSLEKKLSSHQESPKGTLDFGFHKLVREKNHIKQELARVSSKLTPDPNNIA